MKKLYIFIAVIILITPAYAQEGAEQLLKAIVKVKAAIPNEARTAGVLGTAREGNGVLIDADGHILTIGYLILEAAAIEVVDQDGQKIRAGYVGYDHKTGFGLIRAEKAGLGSGDIILKVDKKAVRGLADFYRAVWSIGKAGVEVPVAVLQGIEIRDIVVHSGNRNQYFMISPNK